MFIKKIPHLDQSLLVAAARINCYKDVVEELVYNSVDAVATSIAIRINIDQSSIQVIDNGRGVTKTDMRVVGQRYMTSKYTAKINSKSIPNMYGYRGQSLANIVEVSKTVKITSRYESSDETWEKNFRKGKDVHIEEISRRPSKGTTVDIKGLFYNRHIKAKSINPLTELLQIKAYLEQISLVHTNISLSLRDDSKNEIIFQLHKKRDIYQTLSCLYSIDVSKLQELTVQKNEYSVTAFIAKEIKSTHKDLIFLNRRCVDSKSKIHQIVNDNLKKHSKNQYHSKKSKIKYDDEENYLYKNQLPFYFLFIRCPIKDYDVIDKLIQFSDWNQVTKLLEKLVMFYVNDIKLKPVKPLVDDIPILENEKQSADTRNQVKKIMDKILACDSKVLGISQMRNGIKGKISKRKYKKKQLNSLKKYSQSTLKSKYNKHYKDIDKGNIDYKRKRQIQSNTMCNSELDRRNMNISIEELHKTIIKSANTNDRKIKKSKCNRTSNELHLKEQCKKSDVRKKIKSKTDQRINRFGNDPVIRKFVNPTDSVKKRCKILSENAHDILIKLNKRHGNLYRVDKSVQCNYSNKNNKNIIANEALKYTNNEYHKYKIGGMHIQSTIDLLKPVIVFQDDKTNVDVVENSVVRYKNEHQYNFKLTHTSNSVQNGPAMSKLTYESHNYEMITSNNFKPKKRNNLNFISKESIDNFTVPSNINIPKIWQKTIKSTYRRHLKEKKRTFFEDMEFNADNSLICTSIRNIDGISQNIFDLPKSNTIYGENNTFEEINAILSNFNLNYQTENLSLFIENTNDNILSKTYTLPRNNDEHSNLSIFSQGCIPNEVVLPCQSINEEINIGKKQNVFSVNNSITYNTKNTHKIDDFNTVLENKSPDIQNSNKTIVSGEDYAPLNVCEAVYHSNDIFENEFEFSFHNNSKQKYIPNTDNSCKETCKKDKDCETYDTQNNSVNCSHHFNNNNTSKAMRSAVGKDDNVMVNSVVDKQITDPIQDKCDNNQLYDTGHNDKSELINYTTFNLKNRLRFVPKGMSPIFKNCNTKQTCNYNLDTDYYHASLYQNFANDVHMNSEIYEDKIQNIKSRSKHLDNGTTNVGTNDISLDFEGRSLENALILNQVDNKFIAAIIKHNGKQNTESNILVLFDQHAVHERIRLENNMSEYFTGGQWKSIAVDSMAIPLPKEELIYLHNYKDKFSQLGLQWTMSSNEITINAIPEAILGKNSRQADKILNAVRNLFAEEINIIKSQKGCFSLHPKSIMELVFSEACRYAIMFGDKLTKDCCGELIKSLSKCKKPFQCAHGRPVMAAIMDLQHNKYEYKANLTKLKHLHK